MNVLMNEIDFMESTSIILFIINFVIILILI